MRRFSSMRTGKHRSAGWGRRGLGRVLVIVPLTLALPLGVTQRLFDYRPMITVLVNGHPFDVIPGTTYAELAARLHLTPKAGALLDVEGVVLRAGVYPGRILLNDAVPVATARLFDRWSIRVIDGRNRTEALATTVVRIPGGKPGNPQFFLGTEPGEQIITKGAISDKVVSSVFRPTGPARRPQEVALTFDDGPWPDSTEAILSVLKKHKVHATFFVVGTNVEARPQMIKEEVRAGMEVESHSWDHPNSPPFRDLSPRRIRTEIKRCRDLLRSLGVRSTLFRSPGGSYSNRMIDIAGKLGARVVLWSVDPRDWAAGATAKQIARSVLSNVRPGSIVILHDGGGDRSATVAALPKIIRGVRKMGLQFSTVLGAS